MTIELSCLCGDVRIELDEAPDFMHECNCSLCRKTGAQWGYFNPDQVVISGGGETYVRKDKDVPSARIHFCRQCGATIHFRLTKAVIEQRGDSVMGVNMKLAEINELTGIELRFPDGASWNGVGGFVYIRDAETIGT